MPDLSTYIDLIKQGNVVAFPTETVYGLGADAWNPTAIQKIFSIKGRPSDNPLIVHVSEEEQVHEFSDQIPDSAHVLIEEFWPGPLSLVLPKKPEVLDAVTAGLDTVAIRMPDHDIALEFISETGPLVAPSANKSGRPSPTKAEHVKADFGDDFPVIDGKATKVGLESTVLDLTGDQPEILRPGSISRKQIEDVLGFTVHESFFAHMERPKSPGQKYSHYKPKAEVRWLEVLEKTDDPECLYLLLSSDVYDSVNIIDFNNDLDRLARQIYDRFRQADIEGYSAVAIENFQDMDHPIIPALLNRVQKAIG
ncbi:MAG: threonylcarbamoyl-AMP synthase [Gracilimonas sp.]|uniref:Threonylcarbamoyl-AMP synthase n=1 Tax=Gracilimonas sediminicola TaxID=2952158 RepID=A0A9X2RH48_9BACT|nr:MULTISPECIES: L-threonylcarbamoyladenylate synthase [Gracilimonas]MBO6586543.1 threonylcarbamoyl-AMP synthase [Gracilimonas sp.]MBO6615200.1 threonylcarbamoyl-AMP synthase [Gracilimonas sp.]MCP9292872.1 L-threonylcarbamoyladenylate synthase [Gracilimonas sediminicola]